MKPNEASKLFFEHGNIVGEKLRKSKLRETKLGEKKLTQSKITKLQKKNTPAEKFRK